MLTTDPRAQTAGRPIGLRLQSPPVPNDLGAYAMRRGFIRGTMPGIAANTNPKLWGLGWFLVPAAALLLRFLMAVKLRKQRSLGVSLPGIAGLTLSAPAAYYVATGSLDATAWGLWAAYVIDFVGTVCNVRAWFAANKQKKGGCLFALLLIITVTAAVQWRMLRH